MLNCLGKNYENYNFGYKIHINMILELTAVCLPVLKKILKQKYKTQFLPPSANRQV